MGNLCCSTNDVTMHTHSTRGNSYCSTNDVTMHIHKVLGAIHVVPPMMWLCILTVLEATRVVPPIWWLCILTVLGAPHVVPPMMWLCILTVLRATHVVPPTMWLCILTVLGATRVVPQIMWLCILTVLGATHVVPPIMWLCILTVLGQLVLFHQSCDYAYSYSTRGNLHCSSNHVIMHTHTVLEATHIAPPILWLCPPIVLFNFLTSHSLQKALFSEAPLETQVTTRWQQVSLISPSHKSYTRGTTSWYGSANHCSYARKVPKFA